MTSKYGCYNCKSTVYVDENNQNRLEFLSPQEVSQLKKIVESEQKINDYGEEYLPFTEGVNFIDLIAKWGAVRCSACEYLNFYDATKSIFQYLLRPDDQVVLPIIGDDELYEKKHLGVISKCFEYKEPKWEGELPCECGVKNIKENKKDYDYLMFSNVFLDYLLDEDEEPQFTELPIERRMEYIKTIAYKVYICSSCGRFVIIGNDFYGKLFKASFSVLKKDIQKAET